MQSIEAESFGKLLETKKSSGHTQDQVLCQAAQGKRSSSCSWEVFGRSGGRAQSLRVQQLPVQQQARLNHGLHEARSSKP